MSISKGLTFVPDGLNEHSNPKPKLGKQTLASRSIRKDRTWLMRDILSTPYATVRGENS